MIYRIKYEKRDEVKYIGHLDTMRTFTRCIKRSELPIKFSTGFNPRVQLSFALPLGVGVTSECEYVDLELSQEVAEKEIVSKLNKVMPEGFRIITTQKEEDTKSLMSLVSEAKYEINITSENIRKEQIEEILKQEEIIIQKDTKGNGKKISEINLKEYIIDFKVEEISYNVLRITVHCYAGSEKNLNPNHIIEAIKKYLAEVSIEDYDIHRKELKLR